MRILERTTAMSVRVRRRNEVLEYFIRKYAVRCAFCNEPIDPKSFQTWEDQLVIRHHDNDANNKTPENEDLMHKACYHKARRKGKPS